MLIYPDDIKQTKHCKDEWAVDNCGEWWDYIERLREYLDFNAYSTWNNSKNMGKLQFKIKCSEAQEINKS